MDRRDLDTLAGDYVSRIGEKLVIFDDFLTCNSTAAPAAGAVRTFDHNYWCIGAAVAPGTGLDGTLNVLGDATRAGQFYLTSGAVSVSDLPFTFTVAAETAILKMRYWQAGSAAGTRRIGFMSQGGTFAFNAEPTDGIYMRNTLDANFELVCRSGGAETTLDSGVDSVSSTPVVITLTLTTTKVTLKANEVPVGSITTNIPTAVSLYFGGGNSAITASEGLSVDYIYIERPR